MSEVSKACCSLPPVIATGYKEKGSYSTINGMKTYITGPKDAKTAILIIGDIFGFSAQSLQGADILSSSSPEYLVFHPDFFDGAPAHPSWFMPDSADGPAKIQEFFGTKAAPGPASERLPKFVSQVAKTYSGIEKWGVLGLCWGGKVASLTASGDVFKVGVQVHPAMLDPQDAVTIEIPFATLASGEEDAAHVEAFGKNLKGEKLVDATTFKEMGHGWMAARADLGDEKVKEGYAKGYKMVLEFFQKYL